MFRSFAINPLTTVRSLAAKPLFDGMNHSLPTNGGRRGRCHGALRAIAATVSCALFAACPSPSSNQTPAQTLVFSQPSLYIEPGESAKVLIASNLFFSPSLANAEQPGTAQPLPESPLTLSLEQPELMGRSVLNVTVAADARPGRHEVRFSLRDQPDLIYRIIVVPTDATPRMAAVASIAAGELHSLALKSDGTVWAWGRNAFGQLGDGTLIDRTVPVQVVALPLPAIAIAAGSEHSLAILQDNTLWGWGNTGSFRLRTMGSEVDAQPLPVQVSEPNLFAAEATAGDRHTMLRNGGGGVVAWGSYSNGQTTASSLGNLTPVSGLPFAARQIEAAYDVSYAVLADGMLWAWGDGSFGQLGPAATGPQAFARPVQTVDDVDEVRAGLRHTLVLSNGTVRAFGDNLYSQLGDGSLMAQTLQPVIVPRLLSVQRVAAGRNHSLALQANQRVLHWGLSVNGQAGVPVAPPNQTRNYQLLPEVVTGLPGVSAIDAGSRHSLAVTTTSQSIYAWGNSTFGQLGDGTVATSRPVAVPVYGSGGTNAERHALTLLARGRGTVSAAASGNPIVAQGDASTGLAYGVSQGAVVTLLAEPDAGSAFLGWGGQASGRSSTVQVTMNRSRACLARFGTLPVAEFEAIQFVSSVLVRAEVDADIDGCIVLWEWDVGNDGSIDATGPEYEFVRPEEATEVRLRVTDNDGLTAASVQTVTGSGAGSGNQGGGGSNGLVADFYVLPEQPLAQFPTTFGGFVSSSPNGPLSNWQWDFTNDGTFDASGGEVTHTYNDPGTYSVRLVITDQQGQTAATTRELVVIEG